MVLNAPAAKGLMSQPPAQGATPGLKSMQVFTSSGTWTKPANVTKIKVTVLGGGGGGGGAASSGSGAAAGGGGGGGVAVLVMSVSAITTVTVTIGAAGSAGTSSNNGGTGGTSSFGAYCSATGGTGGAGAADGAQGNGGTGGIGSSGTLNFSGGPGASGILYSGQDTWGGHGGSPAGFPSTFRTTANGQATVNYGTGGLGGRAANNGYAGTAGLVIVEEF